MTYEGMFDELKLHEKIKKLQDEFKKIRQLIEEKNSYIRLQDKEIDTLKGQIDLKELEIEMLKKNDKNIAR